MQTIKILAVCAVGASLLTGCFTMSREEVAKEYERLTSLPPAARILSPCKPVDDVARASYDLFNFVQPLLKEYVAATTNHREYTGFMNDVQFVMKDENLSREEAMKKVVATILEEDKARAEADKVWPKVMIGWQAADALDPVKKLAEIARLALRNQEIVKSAKALPKAFDNEDLMSKAQRGAECYKILGQLAESAECLGFLGEQYRRVQLLKNYRK